MRSGTTLLALVGCAGLVLGLGVSHAPAHVLPTPPPAVVSYDSFNHLECYQIRDEKGARYTYDTLAHDANLLPPRTLGKSCTIKRSASQLCVDTKTLNMVTNDPDNPVPPPAEGDVSALGPVPEAYEYLCYKVVCDRDSQPKGVRIQVKDRFGQRIVTMKKVRKLCVPLLDWVDWNAVP